MSPVARLVARHVARRAARLERREAISDAAYLAAVEGRERIELAGLWGDAMAECGFGRMIMTPLGGAHRGALPRVVRVELPTAGRSAVLWVARPPAVMTSDLESEHEAIADALGVWGLRMVDAGERMTRVELLTADPLAAAVVYPLPCPAGHLAFGRDATGGVVSYPLAELPSIALQGSNGSGKSTCAYSLLAQAADYGPLVDVVGIDPTGRLLGPWGAHPDGLRVCGTDDASARYTALLGRLVADMDARATAMPADVDQLSVSVDTPLRLVVLEELPGISRRTGYKSSGAGSEAQRHIAALASEGRKYLYRLVVIGQRLGSDVLATDVRDQLNARVTFGCRDLATLRMLSPEAGPEHLAQIAGAAPGVGLAELPGLDLTRLRAPYLGDYTAYRAAIGAPPTVPPAAPPTPPRRLHALDGHEDGQEVAA